MKKVLMGQICAFRMLDYAETLRDGRLEYHVSEDDDSSDESDEESDGLVMDDLLDEDEVDIQDFSTNEDSTPWWACGFCPGGSVRADLKCEHLTCLSTVKAEQVVS